MSKQKMPTNVLAIVLGVPGLIIGLMWARFKNAHPGLPYQYVGDTLSVFLLFSLWGILGIICAIRKELPQVTMVKGKPAVILGLIFAAGSWFWALYALYLLIRHMIAGIGR